MAEKIESYVRYAIAYSDSAQGEFQNDDSYTDTKEMELRIALLKNIEAVQRVALRRLWGDK